MSANANANDINCVRSVLNFDGTVVTLINDCNRPVEVSVSWTNAGGRQQIRNVTVPANGRTAVNVGNRATDIRMGAPRRVVPRT